MGYYSVPSGGHGIRSAEVYGAVVSCLNRIQHGYAGISLVARRRYSQGYSGRDGIVSYLSLSRQSRTLLPLHLYSHLAVAPRKNYLNAVTNVAMSWK